MIEATAVSLTYPDQTSALKKFDLKIGSGEMIYVIGPSGSGKTSLLKLLMGVEYPTGGKLKVLNQPIAAGEKAGIRRMRTMIGPVFQEFKLINGRTALDNVILGMRFLDFKKEQMKENALNALKKVGLEHKALSLVDNLSWGEHQRIAIARAVARRPRLILADEPTGNLDKENAISILKLLSSLRDEKTSVIVTTHATHLIEGATNIKLITIENGSLSCERIR